MKRLGRAVKCVECGSKHIWRKGFVPSRGGQKERLVCFDCGRSFYMVVEQPKMKVKAKPKTAHQTA